MCAVLSVLLAEKKTKKQGTVLCVSPLWMLLSSFIVRNVTGERSEGEKKDEFISFDESSMARLFTLWISPLLLSHGCVLLL